ncbi:magnesium transporter [Patescibacteria group bacterium]
MHVKDLNPFGSIPGRLRDVLFGRDRELLSEFLPKVGDDELVHTIDSLSPNRKLKVFRALPPERRVRVLLDLSEWSAGAVLERLTVDEVWELVSAAASDDAADIIQWLDPSVRDKVIARLRKNDDPQGLLPLLVFEEHTAGGRMKTEILKFREGQTVEEARTAIVGDREARQKSHYVYVVDRADTLSGRLSLIRMMQAQPDAPLSLVMQREISALPVDMDQEDAAIAFDEEGAIELPVVNHRGKLLGVITADDVFAVMEEEHGEDVSRMVGVHEDAHISDPVLLSSRRRLPWLGVNLVTAMIAASVIGLFSGTIERLVVLAAFMPVVAGMGGNAAQQALAVTLRSMAMGEFRHLRTLRVVVKEIAVGSLNGLLAGAAVGTLAALWTGNPLVGLVLVMAMTLTLLVAGLVGVAVPVTMRAMNADPALASTVFVTASTDIFGFFAFLGLATMLL